MTNVTSQAIWADHNDLNGSSAAMEINIDGRIVVMLLALIQQHSNSSISCSQ